MWWETDRKAPTDVHFVITQPLLSLSTCPSCTHVCMHVSVAVEYREGVSEVFIAGNPFEIK